MRRSSTKLVSASLALVMAGLALTGCSSDDGKEKVSLSGQTQTSAAPTTRSGGATSAACGGAFGTAVTGVGWTRGLLTICRTASGSSLRVTNTERVPVQVRAANGSQLLSVASTTTTGFAGALSTALATQVDDPGDGWTPLVPGQSIIADSTSAGRAGLLVAEPANTVIATWVTEKMSAYVTANVDHPSTDDAKQIAACGTSVTASWRSSTSILTLDELLADTIMDDSKVCLTLVQSVARRTGADPTALTSASLAPELAEVSTQIEADTLGDFVGLAHATVTLPG